MNRRRILAVIMSVFMMLSLLPVAVFADTTAVVLDGQLKIQGSAAAGITLSADMQGIKNEGITEDSVSYQWFRKTSEDEKKEQQGEKTELKSLGKEKTYTVTKEDIDSKIVLTITGLEDKGFSGSLTAVTETVTEAAPTPETKSDEAGSESVDGIPAATNDSESQEPEQDTQENEEIPESEQNTQETQDDGTSEPDQDAQDTEEMEQSEYQEELFPAEGPENTADDTEDAGGSSVEGIPAATEDGTYNNTEDTGNSDTDETSYQAEAEVGEGSSDVVDFGTVVSGQEDEQVQYVTIKNTGTESLNFEELSPEHFAVQDITEPLEAGQSVQVWIAPRVGTQPGSYEDTITYETEEGAEASFKAQMTITGEEPQDTPTPTPAEEPQDTPIPTPTQALAESKVNADKSAVEFKNIVEGYTEAPQEEKVTLTNEGDADAVLSDVYSDQGDIKYFDVALSTQNISANGGTADFTVRPKTGLSAGTYTEAFTITDTTSGQKIVIPVSIVIDTASHKLGISTDTLDFASAKKGYSGISAQQITVTNNGNVSETIVQPSAEYFSVTATSELTIQPEGSATFTVVPKEGLEVNNYQESIKISSSATEVSFKASFQVLKGTVSLTKIQNPSEISGIANGTAKDAQKLKLPSIVVIETTGGNAKAKVSWDVKNCSYNASDTAAQNFTVKGSVTLPDGVDNDNNIDLLAYIKVNVEAYVPKAASADDNKITGIEVNGVYTTQSKISFAAVGAGMDNNSPKKGDVRYVPLNWTVINTNAWEKAPYTACFGLSKSGDYTLKVVFQQQQYNGENWKNTDTQDTKQVAFSISEAKVTAPGTNLTPTANQKKSVRTNDPTVILPFVIVLFIAVGAVCGVIYYKKKKK